MVSRSSNRYLRIAALAAALLAFMAVGAAPAEATSTSQCLPVVSSGGLTTLVVLANRTMVGFGANDYGYLGNGKVAASNQPLPAYAHLAGVASVAGMQETSTVLRADGSVLTAGYNGDGELGNNSNYLESTAPVYAHIDHVIRISGGSSHELALRSDGTVYGWGYNASGQVGVPLNGSTVYSGSKAVVPQPTQVSGPNGSGKLGGAVAIAAGGQHSLALATDGTVWAWGDNYWGQLGTGTLFSQNPNPSPVKVLGPNGVGVLNGVVGIAAASGSSYALRNDGTVWAWGNNDYGELGDGTKTTRAFPAQVVGTGGAGYLTNVRMLAAGGNHVLALLGDGSVVAWGEDYGGSLGNGQMGDANNNYDNPIPAPVLSSSGTGSLSAIAEVDAGGSSSFAVGTDGTLWAWGDDNYGELGDGTNTNKAIPVRSLAGPVAMPATC